MNEKLQHKTKQILFMLIKLSIVAGAFYFIYNKLVNNDQLDLETLIQTIKQHHILTTKNIIILLLFTTINWTIEIFKWRTLVSVIKPISFNIAFQQSLGAHTAALFTPNRIGEYGAKAIYFLKHERKRIMFLNFLGNMYQLVVTIFFGIVGLLFLISNYKLEINSEYLYKMLIALLLVGSAIYYGEKQSRFTIKGFSLSKIKNFAEKISRKVHLKTVLLSILRYVIFSHQFYFLIYVFNLEIDYVNSMIMITSMYIISSAVPMIFLFDVVVKGSIAVWLFSLLGISNIIILTIITIMWLLNFVLPCLAGSYFVINFDGYKQIDLAE